MRRFFFFELEADDLVEVQAAMKKDECETIEFHCFEAFRIAMVLVTNIMIEPRALHHE